MEDSLLNLSQFRQEAGKIFHQNKSVDVVYFNIVNFRKVNEQFGFEAGDSLLKTLTDLFLKMYRGWPVAGISGDHFVIASSGRDCQGDFDEIRNIFRKTVRAEGVYLAAGQYRILSPEEDPATAADRAKFAADTGRNAGDDSFRVYDNQMDDNRIRKQYVTENIDEAIEKGYVRAYYQPVIRTLTGEVCGYEALARWKDPAYGLLGPDVFISALEEKHQIHKLDGAIIRQVCQMLNRNRQNRRGMEPVSFNLSRVDFEMCDTLKLIEEAVHQSMVPKEMMHIEITESILNSHPDFMQEQIQRFHEAGYQVWMDDFGSGYSTLNTLKDYDFDLIKLDMKFLSDFTPKSRQIITSVIDMAKNLGVQTLAEGVETQEQLDFLKEIGCEKAQGYLFSRPLPMVQCQNVLQEKHIGYEAASDRSYVNALGGINVLSTNPMNPARYQSLGGSGIPLAIAEYRTDGNIHFLYANQAFSQTLTDLNTGSVAELEQHLRKGDKPVYQRCRDFAAKTAEQSETGEMNIVENGEMFTVSFRRFGRKKDTVGVLIRLVNLSRDPNFLRSRMSSDRLKDIYAMYESVCVIHPDTKRYDVIYSTMDIAGQEEPDFTEETVRKFAGKYIYEPDRERYLKFICLTDLEERIRRSGNGAVDGNFRFKSADGSHTWKQVTMMDSPDDAENSGRYYLFCIRAVGEKQAEELNRKEEERNQERLKETLLRSESSADCLTEKELWNSFARHSDLGIFWKDQQRRFLGVSQKFLTYYGLKDVSEVLGKTDEEMEWHVSGDRYEKDEWKVLRHGVTVSRVPGQCIVQGIVRDIEATKMPVYRNGRIVGLAGYFEDITDRMSEAEKRQEESGIDSVTGLYNLRGLMQEISDFLQGYIQDGQDIAYIYVRIRNLKELNEIFGQEMTDKIQRQIAERMKQMFGTRSVIAHVMGENYVVMQKAPDMKDLYQAKRQIENSWSDVYRIDGNVYTVYPSVGIACFSEVESFEDLRNLAQSRERAAE